MRALVLNTKILDAIAAAVAAARARPVTGDTFKLAMKGIDQDTDKLALKDRPPDFEPARASYHVLIPMGFRAAISFEDQPAGLVRHLSISVEDGKPGAMPHPAMVVEIARAFGFVLPDGYMSFDRAWTEEYEPGKWAINVLQLDETLQ